MKNTMCFGLNENVIVSRASENAQVMLLLLCLVLLLLCLVTNEKSFVST